MELWIIVIIAVIAIGFILTFPWVFGPLAVLAGIGWYIVHQSKKRTVKPGGMLVRRLPTGGLQLMPPGTEYMPLAGDKVFADKFDSQVIPLPKAATENAPQQNVLIRWRPYEPHAYAEHFFAENSRQDFVCKLIDLYVVNPFATASYLNEVYAPLYGIQFMEVKFPPGYGPPPPAKPEIPQKPKLTPEERLRDLLKRAPKANAELNSQLEDVKREYPEFFKSDLGHTLELEIDQVLADMIRGSD